MKAPSAECGQGKIAQEPLRGERGDSRQFRGPSRSAQRSAAPVRFGLTVHRAGGIGNASNRARLSVSYFFEKLQVRCGRGGWLIQKFVIFFKTHYS